MELFFYANIITYDVCKHKHDVQSRVWHNYINTDDNTQVNRRICLQEGVIIGNHLASPIHTLTPVQSLCKAHFWDTLKISLQSKNQESYYILSYYYTRNIMFNKYIKIPMIKLSAEKLRMEIISWGKVFRFQNSMICFTYSIRYKEVLWGENENPLNWKEENIYPNMLYYITQYLFPFLLMRSY